MKTLTLRFPALRQLVRYGFVGVMNNALGYLIYLLITFLGVDPKITITILYPIGVLAAYFGHSKYSFRYQGRNRSALLRFFTAYFIGYGLNVMMLFVFSDKLKFPHQAVQACAVFVVAGALFLMLKYFVFPKIDVELDEKVSIL